MKYNIDLGSWGKVFAIPGSVVEKYIKLASGSALKVLLFMLYYNDKEYSRSEIAMALNIPEESVEDAFCFWEQVDVIRRDGVSLSKGTFVPEAAPLTVIPVPDTEKASGAKLRQKSTASLTPREIAERIENSEGIAFLFSAAESAMQHLLTHTEQRSLIWMHDYLGIPADVILMLLEYCRVINKLNVRYIETVAISWQEKEILTHELAEKEIQNLKDRHGLTARIMSAFGINRKLSGKEEEYIADWTAKSYDIDLISYAYDKTIDSINKLSFPYINKILNGWYAKGMLTREQIDKDNQSYSKSFAGKDREKEHSYDLDKFDMLALNYTPKILKESEE